MATDPHTGPDRAAAYPGVITADTRLGDIATLLTTPDPTPARTPRTPSPPGPATPVPGAGLVIETVEREVARGIERRAGHEVALRGPGTDLEIADAARARRAPAVATAATAAAGYTAWGLAEAAAVWGPAGAASAVVASTCAVTAVALPVLRARFRDAIPESWRRRWWLSGALGAAWVDLAAATGPATALMTGGLVAGSVVLHARWAAEHEVPYPSQLTAVPAPLALPAPDPVVLEAPAPLPELDLSRAKQLEDAWYDNIVGGRKIAPGSRLTDRTELPNGVRWTIELDPSAGVSSTALQRRQDDVALALEEPENHVILEPGKTAARTVLTVVTRDLLGEGVPYRGPEYDNGRVPVGMYADGSGEVCWIAWEPGQGVRNGLATGDMGSGKTALLELVALGLRSTGSWRVWWGDGDPLGNSSNLMMDSGTAHWATCGAEGLLAQLQAFEAVLEARGQVKKLWTEDPVTGLPVPRTHLNQPAIREFMPCPRFPGYMWFLPELYTISQDPVLTEHKFIERLETALRRSRKFGLGVAADTQSALGKDFKSSTTLRSFLQMINPFVMRTTNKSEQHVVNGLTVSPGLLPDKGGYGFVAGRGRVAMMRTCWTPDLHQWVPSLPPCVDDPDAALAIAPFLPTGAAATSSSLEQMQAEVEVWRTARRTGERSTPDPAVPSTRPTSVGGVAVPKAPSRATVTPLHPAIAPDLLVLAAELVVTSQFGSPTMLHRKLRVLLAQAEEVMRQLQDHGVVGPRREGKAREVLVGPHELDEVLQRLRAGGPGPAVAPRPATAPHPDHQLVEKVRELSVPRRAVFDALLAGHTRNAEIIAVTALLDSAVAKHLTALADAGLATKLAQGQWEPIPAARAAAVAAAAASSQPVPYLGVEDPQDDIPASRPDQDFAADQPAHARTS